MAAAAWFAVAPADFRIHEGNQDNIFLYLGVMRQLERFRGDPAQAALVERLRKVEASVAAAVERAGRLASSELWTYDIQHGAMVGLAFGQRAGSETESNAVQLWSTVYPAIDLERQRLGLQ